MGVAFMDLKRQYETLKDELESAALEVLRSGAYIGGKHVIAFENSMKSFLGTKHAVACSNGTDALMMALQALGVNPGDEVITTPFTFFATAESISSVGATPVFADINEGDFNINPAEIERKISPRTKAIMPVHIFGTPCDMDTINAIARKHGLKVVEDAAQAIGSRYKGRMIGAAADIGSFSFYPTKNLGGFGDGGMVTTDDDDLATILLALREHGAAKNGAKARALLHGVRDEHAGSMGSSTDALYNPYKYFNYITGYNSRLDALQAALLGVKLRYLEGFNASRARIAARYNEGLKDFVIVPTHDPQVTCCYHQYAIRTPRKEEMGKFLANKGIGTGAFYPVPLHLQKAYDDLGYREGSLPVAEKIAGQTVCLPIFPELTDREVEEVIIAVQEFVRNSA